MALPEKAQNAMKRFRRLFHLHDVAPPPAAAPSPPVPEGLAQPQPAAALLATPRRQKLLEHIWQRTSLSRAQFDALYLAPIHRFAELVQLLPASEAHHHAWPGGMLDHALEVVAFALKMRQSRLLPVGAVPETQAAQGEAWTAAIAYAALLHDIGKVAVDVHVEYGDGAIWHPWHGLLKHPYRFRYMKGREYRLHGAATGIVYMRVLDAGILDWLSGFSEMWHALLYVLAGQYEHAGVLGEIVTQADQASVAQAIGGNPAKAMAAPKHALQKKLLDGLRYLVREEFKLNQPQASDGWLTQDALWLVSKTVADKLRAHLLSQGIEGIPSKNPVVFDVLQEHGITLATPDNKAIWRATVTSENGWSQLFTFLRVSPALIWEPDQRPESFTGEVSILTGQETAAPVAPKEKAQPKKKDAPIAPENKTVESNEETGDGDDVDISEMPLAFNPLAAEIEGGEPEDEPDESGQVGEDFVAWLRGGITQYKFPYNAAEAFVHFVDGTAFIVTPVAFMKYAYEHHHVESYAEKDKIPGWQWVQRQFMKLGIHRRKQDGLHIWTCKVYGPQRKGAPLSGYLLTDPSEIFSVVPNNNPFLHLERDESQPEEKHVPIKSAP